LSKLSKLFTLASTGLDAPLVTIEVHISSGLPGFSIVGLPEGAVRERYGLGLCFHALPLQVIQRWKIQVNHLKYALQW
jgi:hypothetical protein